MAESAQGGAIQVGDWWFDPTAGELSREGRRVRLEDRAARTLDLLCSQRGQVVSHQTLVDTIWSGRSLSPNSIAVVVADLRRALGDDARSPRLIETVPKRGYRLAQNPVANAPASEEVERRRWMAIGAAAAVLFGGLGVTTWLMSRSAVLVRLSAAVNRTGRADLDPLAQSVRELTYTYLVRSKGLILVTRPFVEPVKPRRYQINCTLALWSGLPTVYLSAVEARSGRVAWTGMALGPEDELPARISKALTEMESVLTA